MGVCTPVCDGQACGDDGCGGVCGACGEGEYCDGGGQCVARPDGCGDGACEAGEDCLNCEADCGCEGGEVCQAGVCVVPPMCEDACEGAAACSDDGFAYRVCSPDPDQPGCSTYSRRVPCAEGRTCEADGAGAVCRGACIQPEVVVLVDRSSSMAGERWMFTQAALLDAAARREWTARLGVRAFPAAGEGCTAGELEAPQYQSEVAFRDVEAPVDIAQTPIAAAFEGLEGAYGDPEDGQSVVLITDGDETCAEEEAAVAQAAALRRRGVRTFVIGIGQQANHDLLGAIAAVGGTGSHYRVADGAALRTALDDVFTRLGTCGCGVGEDRCAGDVLETCRAVDGMHVWGDGVACEYGCDSERARCFEGCDPESEERVCEGDVALRCAAAGGGYEVDEECAFGCQRGAGCNPVCRPGARRCSGDASEVCGPAGDGYVGGPDCRYGCREETGQCHSTCRPGEMQCDGDSLRRCNAQGEIYSLVEDCLFGCDADRLACRPVCRPGDVRCEGDAVTRCNAAGDRFEVVEQCAIACDEGEGCRGCMPYVDARCGADGVERCGADGAGFEPVEDCLCNPATATCLPRLYAPAPEGSVRFDNPALDASGGRVFIWNERESWTWIARSVLNGLAADVACRQLGWPGATEVDSVAVQAALWRTVFGCVGDEMALLQCRTPNDVIDGNAAILRCFEAGVGDAFCLANNTMSWSYRADGVVRRQYCLTGCDRLSGECNADAGDPVRCAAGWVVNDLRRGAAVGPWVVDGDLTVGLERHGQFASCSRRSTGSNDIYFFVAPAAGTYRFATSGAGGDTIVFARTHCVAEGSEVACNDDANGGRYSQIEVELAAGDLLHVFVDSYTTAGRGAYRLTATQVP